MIEQKAVIRFEAINGKGKSAPEEVSPLIPKPWLNIAAARYGMCSRAYSRLKNRGDNILSTRIEETDDLIASGYAIPGKTTAIEVELEQSKNHIIKSIGRGSILYPVYAAEEKNISYTKDPDEVNPVLDPSNIAGKMLLFQSRARKETLRKRRLINT